MDVAPLQPGSPARPTFPPPALKVLWGGWSSERGTGRSLGQSNRGKAGVSGAATVCPGGLMVQRTYPWNDGFSKVWA